MPSKNKPKRLDRNTAWRVQRRKKKQRLLVGGNSRSRKPRPKHKGKVVETKPVEKKAIKKTTPTTEEKTK